MEKKGNKKNTKAIKTHIEERKGPTSIVEKGGKIFLTISAKPGSKMDAVIAVEEDYIGISV